jgi:SAM-dependent methyltransferase
VSPFAAWLAGLEERYLADLTFAEVRRAVQALSSLYVERGIRPSQAGALGSAGRRAAFALYYAPLHFLVVRRVVRELRAADPAPSRILDLGCGTGAAGAAWAIEAGGRPVLLGIDDHPWALEEASRTYRTLGLRGRVNRADLMRFPPPRRGEAVLAAYAVNELADEPRRALLERLLDASRRGASVLVVEPIARAVAPWWKAWSKSFAAAGGRADQWRFEEDLPDLVVRLDRAAGLDHRILTARTLWIPGQLRS